MLVIGRLERARARDRIVALGQRAARAVRPGRLRDGLPGRWQNSARLARWAWRPAGGGVPPTARVW